tara:strand:- start:230 stop:460 length:231 start_codon:yes stop_codon:yes gene_type:complete
MEVKMNWDTKDKLQKISFILAIIGFILMISYSYNMCQRNVVEKTFYGGYISFIENMCLKLSTEQCFRSSVGRAADL